MQENARRVHLVEHFEHDMLLCIDLHGTPGFRRLANGRNRHMQFSSVSESRTIHVDVYERLRKSETPLAPDGFALLEVATANCFQSCIVEHAFGGRPGPVPQRTPG